MEVLRKHYEKLIMENINKKGGNINSAEEIWDNLDYLATKVSKFDEEASFLPVQVKKMLAFTLDPAYRIEYSVTKGENFCEVEATFYWSTSEKPAGIGFKKIYLNQIRSSDMISHEERESSLEATCRGCAASRALTDAGIGMEFYADSIDTNFENEEAEKKLEDTVNEKVPEIPSAEEKKAAAYQKKAKAAKAVVVKEEATAPLLPMEEETVSTSVSVSEEIPEPETNVATSSTISIEDAKKAIADIGTYKGNPLGTILQVKPRHLIWLITQNSAVKEEAKVLVETIPELKNYL